MKFKYKHRTKLVSAFILVAVGLFVMLVTMIMINNRTFSSKIQYYSIMNSADGLQKNPPIKFKGLEIGKVFSFDLTKDNRIVVHFFIYKKFSEKIVQYSVLSQVAGTLTGEVTHFELIVPKYSEANILVRSNSLVPYINSEEGKQNLKDGGIVMPEEGFGGLITKLNEVLDGITSQRTVFKLDDAIKNLNSVLVSVNEVLLRVEHVVAGAKAPEGIIGRVGGESVAKSMIRLEKIMQYLEETVNVIYKSRKDLAPILTNVNKTVKKLNDTLKGVNNNPLIRGGIIKEKKYLGVELND